jgi:hypothetical protein
MANLSFDELESGEDEESSALSKGVRTTDLLLINFGTLDPVAELGKHFIQQQNEVTQHLGAAMASYVKPVLEVTQDVLATYQRTSARIREVLTQTIEKWAEDFRPIYDRLAVGEARMLAAMLRQFHWWPVPGLPYEFYGGLLERIKQNQRRQVNHYFCGWFSWNRYRRLGRMARRWENNVHFHRRRHIYNQALKNHRRGEYSASVPTLLPLIEGISREYLQDKGISANGVTATIKKALETNTPVDIYEAAITDALIHFLDESTYEDTRTGNVLPSGYQLNRHGVLHGLHLHYGTEANSLRCFLWLETLYRCIDYDPEEVEWEV